MTIYRKTLLGSTKDEILRYTSSIEEDREFIEEVVKVLKAHVKELVRRGYVRPDVGEEIIEVLNEVLRNPSKVLSSEFEDVHEGIEAYLRERLGDKAGYLALGRSRNDHVATALRLKVMKEIRSILGIIKEIRKSLLNLAMKYVNTPMPLFTHEQPAQVGSVAQYLLYIDEILRVHSKLLESVLNEVVAKSPLGCGAVVGTNVCLDRGVLARELGFNELAENCIYATTARDFIFLTASVLTSLALELSRVFNDLIAWSSPYLGFVEVGNEHLSTSSLMPHKENPVTLEVMRAWAGESLGELVSIASVVKGTHSGYSLDLQEVNKHCFKVLKLAKDSLKVLEDLFNGNLRFNMGKLKGALSNYQLVTTDVAELITKELRLPYRFVHSLIAKCVKVSEDSGEAFTNCVCEELRKLLKSSKDVETVCRILSNVVSDPTKSLKLKCVLGSGNPEYVEESIKCRLKELGLPSPRPQ